MTPFTPKSSKIFSKNSGSEGSVLFKIFLSFLFGYFNRSKLGNLNLIFLSILSSALINGRSSWIRFYISYCGIYSFIISFLLV